MKGRRTRRAQQPQGDTAAIMPRFTGTPIRTRYPDGTYHVNYISEHGWRQILEYLNGGKSKEHAISAVIPNYAPEDGEDTIPECITALGLPWPCTADDIKQVWRNIARQLHPDAGGDAQAFIAAREQYERALALVEVTR